MLVRAFNNYFAKMLLFVRRDKTIEPNQRIKYIYASWESLTHEQRLTWLEK